MNEAALHAVVQRKNAAFERRISRCYVVEISGGLLWVVPLFHMQATPAWAYALVGTIMVIALALAERIRASRADADEGDIFTPGISATLTALIQWQLSSKHGATIREMILEEGNPANSESGVPVDLKVNGRYPTDAPISAMPPSLLAVLPRLPEGLEYRFVERHMFLYDSEAGLIVDIMRNAIE